MTIDLCYDLREDWLAEGYSKEETAEFDRIDTIEGIENALRKIGFKTERIGNAKSFVRVLAKGKEPEMVFSICEGMYGYARESLVPALCDAYQVPYVFSDPLSLSISLHKGIAKNAARAAGLATADFRIVESEADIADIGLSYPLFAKPVAEGTGKGVTHASKIDEPGRLGEICLALLRQFKQPVIVETFLPGREFTAGVTGTGAAATCAGVMEVLMEEGKTSGIYSYETKSEWEDRVKYEVPDPEAFEACARLALASHMALGCRDGSRVDIKMDGAGIPNFIEINPIAGLNPVISDLPILCRLNGISYEELILRIMRSACARYGMQLP